MKYIIKIAFLISGILFSHVHAEKDKTLVYDVPPCDFDSKFDAVGCYCKSDNKFLYMLRSEHKKIGPNFWDVPGGGVEPGEDFFDAAIRETFEETGILLKRDDVAFLKTLYIRYPKFDFTYHIFETILPHSLRNITLSSEHKDYGFFTKEEAFDLNLMPGECDSFRLCYGLG